MKAVTGSRRNAGPFALAASQARYVVERGDWKESRADRMSGSYIRDPVDACARSISIECLDRPESNERSKNSRL